MFTGRAPAGGDDAVEHIAFREDADDAFALGDDDGTDVVGVHAPRRFHDGSCAGNRGDLRAFLLEYVAYVNHEAFSSVMNRNRPCHEVVSSPVAALSADCEASSVIGCLFSMAARTRPR